MMEDHKPEWYTQAQKGPFGNEKFTTDHADNVMRRIQGDQQRMRSQSGKRLRVRMLAAASFVILLGLGIFVFSGRPSGEVTNEPAQAAVSTQFTEAELQQTAEQAVQDFLGKSYSFDHREWLNKQKQIFFSYKKGENSADIWINYETGELAQAKMSAVLSADKIGSEMQSRAEELKAKLGYADDSAYDVFRYVEYDAGKATALQIQNNFRAEKWRIGFVNGEFEYASATIEVSAVTEEARNASEKALLLLGGNGDAELTLAFRAIGEGEDTLTLHYGSEAAVTIDTATQKIQQVYDQKLDKREKADAEALAIMDRKLSMIDGDPLREKVAPILSNIFGIANLYEYSLIKRGQESGNVTFYKLGNSHITVYYDIDLTIWKVKLDDSSMNYPE